MKVDISGQRVICDVSGQRVICDISGQKVDISGQSVRVTSLPTLTVTSDISGQTVIANVRGFDGTNYNNLFVDTNGFIQTTFSQAVHGDILLGFDNNYADYCSGSSNVGIWSKDNPFALSQNGWYCSTDANTEEVSIYTYINHLAGFFNQSNFTYNDIDTCFAIIQNWNCVNLTTMPLIRVHSSTSRWDYTINAGTSINNGEAVMIHFGLDSRVKTNSPECRRLQYTLTGGTGPRVGSENVTLIELYISATIGQYVNMNVIEGGVYIKNKGLLNYYYTNDKVGREQNDIRSIKTNGDKFNFIGTKLLCDVSGQKVDISGQTVAGKTLWLNTDTQHMDNPASLGDPNVIKSADGAMSTYLNGAVATYDTTTNKLKFGNMAPISTFVTDYDSTNSSYNRSLAVRDNQMYTTMTTGGIVVGGYFVNPFNVSIFKSLRLDTNGRVDISGQRMDISGQRVVSDISGQRVDISGQKVDISGQGVYITARDISSNLPLQIQSTQNEYGRSGLNMYQVYPKKLHYTVGGRTESAGSNVIMGGTGSEQWIYTYTFGKANPQTFLAIMTAGTVPRVIRYEYVDASGNLRLDGSANITTLNTPVTLGTNIISVNKQWMTGSVGSTDALSIRVQSNLLVNTLNRTAVDDYANGVFTVPNGYIGYLVNMNMYFPATGWMAIVKWDANSSRSITYSMFNPGNASVSNVLGGDNGSLGGIYTAGESFAFSRLSAMGASLIGGTFVLEPV